MAMGMTYDEFWNGDCTMVKAFRKAHALKNDMSNHAAWLQGAYFYNALCCVAPVLHAFAKSGTKVQPYPSEPYALHAKPSNRKKRDPGRDYMEAFMIQWNKRFEEKERKEQAENGNDRNTGIKNI